MAHKNNNVVGRVFVQLWHPEKRNSSGFYKPGPLSLEALSVREPFDRFHVLFRGLKANLYGHYNPDEERPRAIQVTNPVEHTETRPVPPNNHRHLHSVREDITSGVWEFTAVFNDRKTTTIIDVEDTGLF